MEFSPLGIVGAGQMGAGIAEVCARAGYDVTVCDVDEAALARGRGAVERSLAKAVERGKIEAEAGEEALARIVGTTDLEALAPSRLVIEAVTEDEALKLQLFADLSRLVGEEAILASNTSSIPIVRLAGAAVGPGRVIGLHFFNPAPIMLLVEIIPSLLTDEATVEAAARFVSAIGKEGVRAPDRAGFIVNAILLPMLVDAARMVDEGGARAEDVDKALTLGAGWPMGPLALADLVGIDTVVAVCDVLYQEFKEHRFAVPPLLRRMVEAGRLGRKAGRGFYNYD